MNRAGMGAKLFLKMDRETREILREHTRFPLDSIVIAPTATWSGDGDWRLAGQQHCSADGSLVRNHPHARITNFVVCMG